LGDMLPLLIQLLQLLLQLHKRTSGDRRGHCVARWRQHAWLWLMAPHAERAPDSCGMHTHRPGSPPASLQHAAPACQPASGPCHSHTTPRQHRLSSMLLLLLPPCMGVATACRACLLFIQHGLRSLGALCGVCALRGSIRRPLALQGACQQLLCCWTVLLLAPRHGLWVMVLLVVGC
jgi:hypothetical protein